MTKLTLMLHSLVYLLVSEKLSTHIGKHIRLTIASVRRIPQKARTDEHDVKRHEGEGNLNHQAWARIYRCSVPGP